MKALTKNRTGLDFSEHELHVTEQEGLLVHFLKKPNTNYECIKFINTNGIMAVTGDYGNWIFCREFHPSAEGYVSDYYWLEKLNIASSQVGTEFDSEGTKKQIEDGIEKDLEEWGYEGEKLKEAKEYYEDLLGCVDESDWYYESNAYTNMPGFFDGEDVPNQKKIKIWLQIVYDGFDEICRRMKEKQGIVDCGNEIIEEGLKVLKEDLKCVMTDSDEKFGFITGTTRATLISWGNEIEISLEKFDDKIVVWVHSYSPHNTFWNLFDSHNIKNEKKIIEAFSKKSFKFDVEVISCRDRIIEN